MEQIIWVRSWGNNDGLNEVNSYLEQGWKVKMISAFANSSEIGSYAYIVIEKEEN